ncbi:MAG TPA: hypothetical protein VNU92_12670 [Edaphobacter sp.]|jgi:hypothetical protein|nr:hypothetical protein [Edaphobacter sp.]
MKSDFRNNLPTQIELLRADISHEELSTGLGGVTERCLARYITRKSFLTDEPVRRAEVLCPTAE